MTLLQMTYDMTEQRCGEPTHLSRRGRASRPRQDLGQVPAPPWTDAHISHLRTDVQDAGLSGSRGEAGLAALGSSAMPLGLIRCPLPLTFTFLINFLH